MADDILKKPEIYETFDEEFYRVYHKEFSLLLGLEIADLLSMCKQFQVNHHDKPEELSLNSGGVYRFVMECTRCEEILDQVRADQEVEWAYFRKLVAIVKHSCSITSNLQVLAVLAEGLPDSVEGSFPMSNGFVLQHFYNILLESTAGFLTESLRLGIIDQNYQFQTYFEKYFTPDIKPLLRLKTDSSFRRKEGHKSGEEEDSEKIREAILHLVSSLLHSCDVIDYLGRLQDINTNKRKEVTSNDLHEETLGAQRELFHSAITFFDTQFVQRQSNMDKEVVDLINHVKVIHLLLSSFSGLMRIEERHYHFFIDNDIQFPLNEDQIQGIIFDFFVNYIDRFRLQIEKISQRLIRKYSVQAKVELPIPYYRGFHVRPSTLVARIVMHYGSNVNMLLKDTTYNAAIPLDLFRANEVINAEKRRAIGKIISQDEECQAAAKRFSKKHEQDSILLQKYFLELFLSLQKQDKIVVYENLALNLLEMPSPEEELLEYVKRQVAYLMATGKIDIASELFVTFEGDSRVLADIAILAEHGYGEDKTGNNVPLPKELSYLRR